MRHRAASSWFWRVIGGFIGFRLLTSGWFSRPMVILAHLLRFGAGKTTNPPREFTRAPDPLGEGICSIRAIHYELGQARDIETIPGLERASAEYKALRDGRVKQYAVCTSTPLELASACVRRTLEEGHCRPEEVDALVLASDRCLRDTAYPDINRFMVDLELTRAYPIGVNLSGCTNFTVALRVGAALRLSEKLSRVLVLGVDTLPLDIPHRVLPPGACVFSDAAVSFVVAGPGEGEYDVLGIEHVSSPHIGLLELRQNTLLSIREAMAGPREAVFRLLANAGKRPKDIRLFLGANLVHGIALAQSQMCGFTPAQCYFDNIPRFSHTYAGDPFINLRDSTAGNPLNAGDLVVLLGTFATSWGAILLRKS